jgi:multiple sugar transport system substrate-binding protein
MPPEVQRRAVEQASETVGGRWVTGGRISRRAVVQTGATGAAALALAACEAPGGAGAAKTAAPAKISVITRGGGDGTGMEQVIIPAFTKQFDNIKVEHASLGGEPDYWAKVVTGHLGKELGDVIWASNGGFSALASRGVFKELEPLARSDKYDFKDYVPGGLDSLKHDGKLMALPWGGHPGYQGLTYNEDLLARSGIRPPDGTWTWDRLIEVSRQVSKVAGDPNSDVYGFTPITDYLGMVGIVRGNGADYLDKEGKKFTLNSPQGIAALNTYRDFYVRHRFAVPIGNPVSAADLFIQGRLALVQHSYGGQFSPGEARIQGRFKWGMHLIPKGTTGKIGTQLTVNGMAQWSGSKAPDAAWKFLRFIMEPETQLPAILSGASRPGLRKSVLRHPKLMSDMKAHAVWVDLIENASPWHQPANYRWAELDTQIRQTLTPAWKGEQTVEQALQQNLPAFDAILAKPSEGFV